MLSQTALQQILGIKDKIYLTPTEMAGRLNVTFHPAFKEISENISSFEKRLHESFARLGVNVVPYESIWEKTPVGKRIHRFCKYSANNVLWLLRKVLFLQEVSFYLPFNSILKLSSGKRIKKNIAVFCLGEQAMEDLQMQHISSFKSNSIITIVDFPANIHEKSDFISHFDTAMGLFAYHMTNIIVAVDSSKWMIYNFNASHPVYSFGDDKFDEHILSALVPKISAPISPHMFSEFLISLQTFDINDSLHRGVVEELQTGARLFDQTKLYPDGKKIDSLPFRHNFHRLIGKLHLDNRSGMSFGFFAFQMPTRLVKPVSLEDFKNSHNDAFINGDLFIDQKSGIIFVLIEINSKKLVLEVPDVWVMTLRSGANKTRFNPATDLLKMGLIKGKMWMEFPTGLKVNRDYKPSFDTKVILAHAVGNAMIASIAEYVDAGSHFAKLIKEKGTSLSHWHGYFNKAQLPKGVYMYGHENPHVSCSSPQSAIYALDGKLKSFSAKIGTAAFADHIGDIHIEPHHGINISYPSLIELAQYILDNPDATALGNKYLSS